MTFEGRSYTPGSVAEEYEFETRLPIQAANVVQRGARRSNSATPKQGDDSREPADLDQTRDPTALPAGDAQPPEITPSK